MSGRHSSYGYSRSTLARTPTARTSRSGRSPYEADRGHRTETPSAAPQATELTIVVAPLAKSTWWQSTRPSLVIEKRAPKDCRSRCAVHVYGACACLRHSAPDDHVNKSRFACACVRVERANGKILERHRGHDRGVKQSPTAGPAVNPWITVFAAPCMSLSSRSFVDERCTIPTLLAPEYVPGSGSRRDARSSRIDSTVKVRT